MHNLEMVFTHERLTTLRLYGEVGAGDEVS